MKNNRNNNPLVLSDIRIGVYNPDSPLAKSYPAIEQFDYHHDFAVNMHQSSLAVLMTLTNDRIINNNITPGIRRAVTVSLVDATDSIVMASTTVNVNIPRGRLMQVCRVDLPFAYANINSDHTYKVVVRDEVGRVILDEFVFHVFDELYCGGNPGKWYIPECGGVIGDDTSCPCRSLYAEDHTFQTIRFQVKPNFTYPPLILPELEIRLFYSDYSIENHYVKPVRDEEEPDCYNVESMYLVNASNRGVCYAELLSMGYPIAGFVFSNNSESHHIPWAAEDMECMDDYTPEAAADRFRLTIDRNKPSHGIISDDALDHLIEEFIESQLEKDEDSSSEEESLDRDEPEPEEIQSTPLFPAEELPMPVIENTEEENVPFLSSLDHLIGLRSVKEKLGIYEKVVRFNKMRIDSGLPVTSSPLHSIFLGSPGTGKTTVAKRMGLMLRRAGVLSRGHVVVRERATLMGPNYSNEETNTLKAIEEAQGGILFIDEAYQLYQPEDPRDPGKFVIETLMTALADESHRDWMLILAGYPDEMKRMFEMNPGFKSRIPDSNIYVFDDFTEPELMEIAERYLERNSYTLSADAHVALAARLGADYSSRGKSFGNARHVINMIQTDILPAMAVRVLSSPSPESQSLSEIHASDIPVPIKPLYRERGRIGF